MASRSPAARSAASGWGTSSSPRPVSHIWYFKGTPSRLGILLDVSPRNLERILYFALYVVSRVDEHEREKALARVEEEMAERIGRAGELVEAKKAELEAAIADKRAQVTSDAEADAARADALIATRSEELAAAGQQVEAALKEAGKTVAEDIVFTPTGEVVAKAGEPAKAALDRAAQGRQGRGRGAREGGQGGKGERGRAPPGRHRRPQRRDRRRPRHREGTGRPRDR